jgi:hypothetical protein
MSKQPTSDSERIPTYEESLASSSTPLSPSSNLDGSYSTRKFTSRQSIQQRTRQERLRRIGNLITIHLEPAISNFLDDGTTHFLLLILPYDVLPSATVTTSNITSPPISIPATILSPTDKEKPEAYKSSFLTQPVLLHELIHTLHTSLLSPSSISPITEDPHYSLPATQIPTSASSPLPDRPIPRSWLSRNLAKLSQPDGDPTGSTGAWNLGWRSEDDTSLREICVDSEEVRIEGRLVDFSVRTESEMGLLESWGIKGLWVEIELRG